MSSTPSSASGDRSNDPEVVFPTGAARRLSDESTAMASVQSTIRLLHGDSALPLKTAEVVVGVPVAVKPAEGLPTPPPRTVPAAPVAAALVATESCCRRTCTKRRVLWLTCVLVAVLVLVPCVIWAVVRHAAPIAMCAEPVECEPVDAVDATDAEFTQFPSCAALARRMRQGTCGAWGEKFAGHDVHIYRGYENGLQDAMPAAYGTAEAAGSAMKQQEGQGMPHAESGTNNQVAGVDEGDIVKAGPLGQHVFTVASTRRRGWQNGMQTRLVIAKVVGGNTTGVVSSTELSEHLPWGASAMFVLEDRVLVVGRGQSSVRTVASAPRSQNLRGDVVLVQGGATSPRPAVMRPVLHTFPTVTTLVLNVSDLAHPVPIRRTDMEGSYVTSRLIGRHAHVITRATPHWYSYQQADEDMTPSALLPFFREAVNATAAELQALAAGRPADANAADKYIGVPPPLMHDSAYPHGFVVPGTGFGSAVRCADVYQATSVNPTGYTVIASVPLAADVDGEATTVTAAATAGQLVYASPTSIYVASSDRMYSPAEHTAVLEFDVSHMHADDVYIQHAAPLPQQQPDGGMYPEVPAHVVDPAVGVELAGGFTVPGHPLNQFAMDEHQQQFRIATTSFVEQAQPHSSRGGAGPLVTSNNVYVFSERRWYIQSSGRYDAFAFGRIRIGAAEHLALGERIKSVRFMGATALVTTFQDVDPLLVLRMPGAHAAEGSNPELLGTLTLPGYWQYLHPVNSTHLLGFGRDVATVHETRGPNGDTVAIPVDQGLKLSLIDISDVSAPRVAFETIIGHRGTRSAALDDHHAFFFDHQRGIVTLPVSLSVVQEPNGDPNLWRTGDRVFQGALVYAIGDTRFELLATVSHDDPAAGNSFDNHRAVRRTILLPPAASNGDDVHIQAGDNDPQPAAPGVAGFQPVAGFHRSAPGTLVTISDAMLLSMSLPSMHALAAVPLDR